MKKIFFTFCFSLFTFSLFAQNNLRLGTALQSHAVIQQGKPLTVWGYANEGSIININADWNKKAFTAVAGSDKKWSVEIPVPKIKAGDFTPHQITIASGTEKIELTDILIGEVWLCSGQSNMDMQMKPFLPWLQGVVDYEKEIAAANYPQIRLFDVASDFKKSPVETCKGEWKICNPENAQDFSAVAYYFGREIFQRLNIPLGLITTTIGATTSQAWTSRETLEANPVFKEKILYPYDTSHFAREPMDSVVTFEKLVLPTLLYNAMIFPLKNISLAGFLWYQGESNRDNYDIYASLNGAMIGNWRALYHDDKLPFYFVQVAPYNWQQNDSTAYNYALFRDAQKDVLKVKHTGMAVTMDIATPDELHPRDKKSVGERLALNALSKTYGIKNIQYTGPTYKSFAVEGSTVRISFEKSSIGKGLTTNDNAAPKYFFVAGSDKKFYYANATIVGNEVWLTCDKVLNPVAVRYAYTNYPITNFCNKDGLPCVPFRTDDW